MSYADEIFERSKNDRAMIVGSEIRGAIQEVRDERDALKADLQTNASLLARQCDMARQAENERDALKAEVEKRTKTLMKILALQKDGEAEIAELRETLEFALRGNNLSMNEATRLRRVLAETGAKEVKA
jgi:hypothetical protein